MFTARFRGKKDRENIKRVLGFSLITALSVSGIYFLVMQVIPGKAASVFTNEKDVIAEGADYLKTVSWSYPVTAFNFCVAAVLRSIRRVRQPMAANISGIAVNTVLNWVLIFGKFGLPAMGVRGAAIATVITRIVEGIILLSFVFLSFRAEKNCAYIKTDVLFQA